MSDEYDYDDSDKGLDMDLDLDPEHAELAAEDREARKRQNRGCACGNDLPGRCPGPDNCPYNQPEEGKDEE